MSKSCNRVFNSFGSETLCWNMSVLSVGVLFALYLIVTVPGDAHDNHPDFGGIQHQLHPLMNCKTSNLGTLSPIPSRPDCAFSVKEKTTQSIVVTVWKQDATFASIPAAECRVKSKVINCTRGFFGGKETTFSERFEPVLVEECDLMIKGQATRFGEMKTVIHNDMLVSSSPQSDQCPWMWSISQTLFEAHVFKTTVHVDHLTNQVIHPSIRDNCSSSQGSCNTIFNGRILWKPRIKADDGKKCNHLPRLSVACIASRSTTEIKISCPKTHMYFAVDLYPQPYLKCKYEDKKHTLILTTDGYVISSVDDSESHSDIISVLTLNRQNFSVARESITVAGQLSEEEISFAKSHLEFTINQWNSLRQSDLARLALTSCVKSAQDWSIAWELRDMVPELAAQMFSQHIIDYGTIIGGMIASWPCQKIFVYRFLENPSCASGWPVEYSDGLSLKRGYVEAITLRLQDHDFTFRCMNYPTPFLIPHNQTFFKNIGRGGPEFVRKVSFWNDHRTHGESATIMSPPLYDAYEMAGSRSLKASVALVQEELMKIHSSIYESGNIRDPTQIKGRSVFSQFDNVFSFCLGGFWGKAAEALITIGTIALLGYIMMVTLPLVGPWLCRCVWSTFCKKKKETYHEPSRRYMSAKFQPSAGEETVVLN